MKEKLVIRNFGPIKNVELDLKRFNVLIGESATGKSTIGKLLAVFRYFSFIVDSGEFTTRTVNHSFWEGLKAWGLDESIKINTSLHYENKHYSYSINPVIEIGGYVSKLTPISTDFNKLIVELNLVKPDIIFDSILWDMSTSFFENQVKKIMDNPFFLPTERGLQSLFSLGRIPNISDSLFNQLAKIYQIAQKFSTEVEIEPLSLYYKNEMNLGKIKKNNSELYISLNKGASGYQSAIPIILVTKYYNTLQRKKTFIIEEPELNLFPSTQNEVVKYLADLVLGNENQLLLTTHSPYILTSLNNLMFAWQVGNEDNKKHYKETNEIIKKKYWVNPDEVSAYQLIHDEKEGGVIHEDIKDSEGLIKTSRIDIISGILNEEFSKLMNIELNITDEVAS